MVEISCKVNNPLGLTSRICAELVAEANRASSCTLTLYCQDETADLKSIMNMMSLIIRSGQEFKVTIEGKNEEEVGVKYIKLLTELDLINK
ncbi:MAG: HPr family phosphocarrier protein [Bacillales bacterium]|nr:HPr family phosphocarrier protein [Bacillales bacterium]